MHNGSYPSIDPSLIEVPSSPASHLRPASVDGFDWADAGLGAGAMVGLTAMAAGAALALGTARAAVTGGVAGAHARSGTQRAGLSPAPCGPIAD